MVADWKIEIVECGDLVQDDDDVTPQDEAERRWNRYVELADSVIGNEGSAGVAAIVASFRAEEDYGAYQSAHAALRRFPAEDLGKGVAQAASDMLAIPKDNSGNVLMILTRSDPIAVNSFNEELGVTDSGLRNGMRQLVEFHESEEWLSGVESRNLFLVPRV
ncbi:hypothetical protein [Amycolatopsis sp. WAC 04169]|uniref:hypothetical protein n=1 Tax=Amycolatopsis sp. WAC 04169 TaxID=2203197 RepID=UPI000F775D73|nr:hypothetical protein [Amycolatopsis sp. WAC 04169]